MRGKIIKAKDRERKRKHLNRYIVYKSWKWMIVSFRHNYYLIKKDDKQGLYFWPPVDDISWENYSQLLVVLGEPELCESFSTNRWQFFIFKSDPSFFLKFYSCSDLTSLFLIIFPVLGGFFLFCLEDVFVITDVTYYIFLI